jgi:hypothetical protein
LTNLVVTLFTYRNMRVRWTLDGQARDEVLNSVIVANASFFGGGMHISPNSKMDDGQFHVITLGDLGKVEFLLAVPRVYNGTHLTHPKVKEYIGREVTVQADGRMFLQAEGDLFGEAPTTQILPRALQVLGRRSNGSSHGSTGKNAIVVPCRSRLPKCARHEFHDAARNGQARPLPPPSRSGSCLRDKRVKDVRQIVADDSGPVSRTSIRMARCSVRNRGHRPPSGVPQRIQRVRAPGRYADRRREPSAGRGISTKASHPCRRLSARKAANLPQARCTSVEVEAKAGLPANASVRKSSANQRAVAPGRARLNGSASEDRRRRAGFQISESR